MKSIENLLAQPVKFSYEHSHLGSYSIPDKLWKVGYDGTKDADYKQMTIIGNFWIKV